MPPSISVINAVIDVRMYHFSGVLFSEISLTA